MKQIVTTGIVLSRTDYGEADRILTFLTPDHGKVHVLAKGVRRVKSKLAGGIELFSVSTIIYSPGRSDLGTLISTRLITHYNHIVENIDRTMLGYELIRQLHKITEDESEREYFVLLEEAFVSLNNFEIAINTIKLWFAMQLLRLNGSMPNLQTDGKGNTLQSDATYDFDFSNFVFMPNPDGNYGADDIKFLRLGFSSGSPKLLNQVQGSVQLVPACSSLVTSMLSGILRV